MSFWGVRQPVGKDYDWREVGVFLSYHNRYKKAFPSVMRLINVLKYEQCPVCDWFNNSGEEHYCWYCDARYKQDMADKTYPKALSEEAKKYFYFENWFTLRLIEAELRHKLISRQGAQEKHDAYIQELNEQAITIETKQPSANYRGDYLE